MGKPLQIRDVPDEVLEVLKRRAERDGESLSGYALKLLAWHASHVDMAEFMDWPAISDEPISSAEIVEVIHQGREERTRRIEQALSRRRSGR